MILSKSLEKKRLQFISTMTLSKVIRSNQFLVLLDLKKTIKSLRKSVFNFEFKMFLNSTLKDFLNKTKLVAKNQPQAIICFGGIVRGDTYHFEMVANAVNEGMNRVAYEFEIPVIQQVLAVENVAQLEERCGVNDPNKNKGIEAAQAAVPMFNLVK